MMAMLAGCAIGLALAVNCAAPAAASAAMVQEQPTWRPTSPQQTEPAPNPPEQHAKTETERYTLSHDRYEKAVAYSHASYTLYFVSVFLSILLLIFFLRLGIVAKFRDIAERASENRFLQALIFVPLLFVALDVLSLPVEMYWHSLSLHFQLSVQRWGSWFWDWSKAELLTIVIAVPVSLLLFYVIRKSPTRWWFYFWLASLPIILFLVFISPWFIEPLFFKFEPLNDHHPELVKRIEEVAQRAGLDIPPDHVFLMYASEKTNSINAYVEGFGASKRIVVFDNTIKKSSPDETLFIFGHEAGHYQLNHVWQGIIFYAILLLIALFTAYRILQWMLDRWGRSWKVYGMRDWATLALFLLVIQVMAFIASPITNAFSRVQEHNADIFGLEAIHGIVPNSSETAAHAFQVLGEADLADPNPSPFITFWLYSHPPLAERLVFAHTYDPWSKKQPPKYIK